MQKVLVGLVIAAAALAVSGAAAAAGGANGALEPPHSSEPRGIAPAARGVDRAAPVRPRSSFRDWTLSVEAALHAPLDYGAQVGFETPFGLRVYGGYGVIPSAYGDAFSSVAGSSTSDARAKAILSDLDFSGHIWRASLGIRPFHRLGLYLDVGYARADLNAGLAVDSSDIPGLGELSGGYALRSRLDLWFFELGYQARFVDRFIVGLGLGMTGTIGSSTGVVALGGAPRRSSLLSQAATRVDDSFNHYGYVP